MPAKKQKELPVDIYITFVETLFRDGVTLALGISAQTLLAFIVYLKTGAPIYLVVAGCLVVVGAIRLWTIRKYRHYSIKTREEARYLENIYVVFGTLQALALGLFCFAGIYWARDPFGEIAAVCITLGTATSIAGRNYGSPRMVMIMIIGLSGPISVALLLRGDVYHIILGLMSPVFFFAIRKFAENIREVLFAALSEEKKANRIAHRFNRALNTMSHGLIMLSSSGRVVVANAQAAEILGFPTSERLIGRTLNALLTRGMAMGFLSSNDRRYAETQLSRALRDGRDRKLLLKLADGRYLEFTAREGHDELGVITFEEVTQRVEAEEKIRFMARYDSLTGLPNRGYFHEVVAGLLMNGDGERLCGLAVFDLDDFKSVNDTLGHPVGDGLIFAVAERLAGYASDNIRISRFGGDEFMIFVDQVSDEEEFSRLMEDIFSGMQGDVDVAGHALRVQLSAGAVVSQARDADVDAMIVKADLALYKAKELGKNGWQLFEAQMDAAFRNKQVMKADLRSAIEARNLRVVYQPIISVDSMRIEACEALCRWDHPELGPISPSVFILLAEEMGLVSEISSFVLAQACEECAKWPEHISVSVNLSAKDFRDRSILDRVGEALKRTGLAPGRLEVEITETALLDDKSSTRTYIEELKALGVRIALDDFGTGYSSLSYLHTLPLDKVKIDGSFLVDVTRNERSLQLLKGVVNLSRQLGLKVTVEGVETFEQLKVLVQHAKPDLAQGFLFGSALTASGISTMSGKTWAFSPKIEKRMERAHS